MYGSLTNLILALYYLSLVIANIKLSLINELVKINTSKDEFIVLIN
jgi:hypothetical protein